MASPRDEVVFSGVLRQWCNVTWRDGWHVSRQWNGTQKVFILPPPPSQFAVAGVRHVEIVAAPWRGINTHVLQRVSTARIRDCAMNVVETVDMHR
jgi:hypothetical protein